MTKPKKNALTPKQERFAHEYVKDLNGKQAAIRCGYSKATAEAQASRLLSNAKVSALVAELKKKALDAAGLTAQKVLDEIALLGFSNLQDLLDEHGNPKPLQTLTRAQAAAIQSVEWVMKNATAGDGKIDRVLKIKTWDKRGSLELLAKHFALLTEVVKHTTDDKRVARLLAGRKRAGKS